MRSVVVLFCSACAALLGRADVLRYVPTGSAPVAFDTTATGTGGQNQRPKTDSIRNICDFQTDGTLKPTGSGDICTINAQLVATNGTLTIDLSDFSFTSGATRTLHLVGGVYCGSNSTFVVTGADAVLFGYMLNGSTYYYSVVNIPHVNLNGATLTLEKDVTLFALPPKAQQDWTILKNTNINLQEDNALSGLYVDNVFTWTGGSLSMGARNPFPAGLTVRVTGGAVYSYPTAPMTFITEGGHKYCDYTSRGGFSGANVDCDFELSASATLSAQLRGQTFRGRISGAGTVSLTGYRMSGSPTVFDGIVDTTGPVQIAIQGFDPKATYAEYIFNDIAFTNAGALTTTAASTNIVIRFRGAVGPSFKTASFQPWVPGAAHASFDLAAGVTARFGSVLAGGVQLTGDGSALIGGIAEGALVKVPSTMSVRQDPSVEGAILRRQEPGELDFTYYGCVGAFRLADHAGETVDILGGSVLVPTNCTATVNVIGNGSAKLVADGADWRQDTNILSWVSGANPNTISNLYVVEGATKEAGPDLAEVGYTTNTSYNTFWVSDWMDCREGVTPSYKLLNARQFEAGAGKAPQFYSSVYLEAKPFGTTDRYYITARTETGNLSRRLQFKQSNGAAIATRDVGFAVVVFGSQNGGGAAVLSDEWVDHGVSTRYFGRKKGIGNSILTNGNVKVWLDGRSVDPTVARFNGGWQVVSLQPPEKAQIKGIGFGVVFTGTGTDAGGQNYAEILLFKNPLTDVQRVTLERQLAKKWGISTYADGGEVPAVTVTGAGSLSVKGEVEADLEDFAGTLNLAGDTVALSAATNVTVTGRGTVFATTQQGVPKAFDPLFEGLLSLAFDGPLTFDVDNRQTAALNAIRAEPALVDVGAATNVVVRNAGTGCEPLVDLVTAGGFATPPTWRLSSSEGFTHKMRLDASDPTALRLKISCRGTVLVIR